MLVTHGKKFQNAISNIGNYNKGQLPILKIKVCIRIVAYYNSSSWNENDKNWQCTVQNQWCPTVFQCVYSRTISSLHYCHCACLDTCNRLLLVTSLSARLEGCPLQTTLPPYVQLVAATVFCLLYNFLSIKSPLIASRFCYKLDSTAILQ